MSHFHHHLNDRQKYTENVLGKLDVRVRLVYLLSALFLSLASNEYIIPGILIVIGIMLMRSSRMSVIRIVFCLLLPFSTAVIIIFMQLFLHEGKQLFAINLFNRDFISTYEGLRIGLVIGLKVMGASALTWSFIAVTPFHHMLAVMKWMHIPEVFTELTMLMFRYLFVLLEAVVNIRNAQVLRSGYTRTQQAMRSFSMLAGMTFIKTWEQANQTAQAMDCRGYQGKVYIQPLVQFTFWHYGQVVIGVIFSFLIYVWQYNFRG